MEEVSLKIGSDDAIRESANRALARHKKRDARSGVDPPRVSADQAETHADWLQFGGGFWPNKAFRVGSQPSGAASGRRGLVKTAIVASAPAPPRRVLVTWDGGREVRADPPLPRAGRHSDTSANANRCRTSCRVSERAEDSVDRAHITGELTVTLSERGQQKAAPAATQRIAQLDNASRGLTIPAATERGSDERQDGAARSREPSLPLWASPSSDSSRRGAGPTDSSRRAAGALRPAGGRRHRQK